MSDFIPDRDGPALTWMQMFSAGITAAPARYQLVPADAAAIAAAVAAYAAAYADSQDPATRTKLTVAVKDQARFAAEQLCRQYAAVIKPNAGIGDADKLAIGVPPPNNGRTPVPAPASWPDLSILNGAPAQQVVRYSDVATPDSSAKPFGVERLELFVAVEAGPTGDVAAARYRGSYSRSGIAVNFTAADKGKTATYFARWVSTRGEAGPWSPPASLPIAA